MLFKNIQIKVFIFHRQQDQWKNILIWLRSFSSRTCGSAGFISQSCNELKTITFPFAHLTQQKKKTLVPFIKPINSYTSFNGKVSVVKLLYLWHCLQANITHGWFWLFCWVLLDFLTFRKQLLRSIKTNICNSTNF